MNIYSELSSVDSLDGKRRAPNRENFQDHLTVKLQWDGHVRIYV